MSRARSVLPILAAVTLAACSGGSDAAVDVPADDTIADAATDDTADGTDVPTGERITIGDDEALVWGDGDRGVVLSHGSAFDAASWEAQAVPIADLGYSVVAVENTSGDALAAAVDHLRDDVGVDEVVLIGGSSGADSILGLVADRPDVSDGIVLLSPNRVVDGLGDQPKLFIASEDESVADVSTELASSAEGDDNEVVLLPGAAHAQNIFDSEQADAALDAILDRLGR